MGKKETPWFPHDSNARNDEKLLAVRMRLGIEGYGLYFMILERLRDETDFMSVTDYNVIAFDFRSSSEKVKAVVCDFGLFQFTEDGKYFYSESLNERMIPVENSRRQRSEAGKTSAERRAEETRRRELEEKKNAEDLAKRAKSNDRSTTVDESGNDRCQKIQQRREEKRREDNKEIVPKGTLSTPHEEILALFNQTCVSLPKVLKLSPSRKEKVKLRYQEMGMNLNTLQTVFEKVESSAFCKGKNERGWVATFDWIFDNDRNWLKIIEGKYDNRAKKPQRQEVNAIWE